MRERRDRPKSKGRFGDDEQSSRSRSSRFGFFSGQRVGRRLRRAGPTCRGVRNSGAPTGVHGTACVRSPGLYGANSHLYGTDSRLYGTPGVCRAGASSSALAFASNIRVRAWILAWMARPLAWVALIFAADGDNVVIESPALIMRGAFCCKSKSVRPKRLDRLRLPLPAPAEKT
jgi:hypothetical protein